MRFLLPLALFILSFTAYALPVSTTTGSSLYFSAGTKAGYGKLKSVNGTTIVSRGFGVYGLNADLGFRMGLLVFGGGVEYSLWRQVKDPAKIGNSNAQGSELSWGAMLGIRFESFTFLGRYYLKSVYDMDRPDTSGRKVSYLKPSPAYVVQLRFPVSETVYSGLEYKSTKYEETEVAAVGSALSAGNQLKASAYSLLLGLAF